MEELCQCIGNPADPIGFLCLVGFLSFLNRRSGETVGASFPAMCEKLLLIAGCAAHTDWAIGIGDAQRYAVYADARWQALHSDPSWSVMFESCSFNKSVNHHNSLGTPFKLTL